MAFDNVDIKFSCDWTPPSRAQGDSKDRFYLSTGNPYTVFSDIISEYIKGEDHPQFGIYDVIDAIVDASQWLKENPYLKGEKQMFNREIERFYKALTDPHRTATPVLSINDSHLSPFPFKMPVQINTVEYDSVHSRLSFEGVAVSPNNINPSHRPYIRRVNPGVCSYSGVPDIEKVIFNDPATIVFWKDGSKTVVKTQNEKFDPEKGLAMAVAKKALGNEGNYFNVIKSHVDEYRTRFSIEMNADALTLLKDNKPVYRVDGDGMGPASKNEHVIIPANTSKDTEVYVPNNDRIWRIWWEDLDNGRRWRHEKEYKRKGDALRVARQISSKTGQSFIVSKDCPWD